MRSFRVQLENGSVGRNVRFPVRNRDPIGSVLRRRTLFCAFGNCFAFILAAASRFGTPVQWEQHLIPYVHIPASREAECSADGYKSIASVWKMQTVMKTTIIVHDENLNYVSRWWANLLRRELLNMLLYNDFRTNWAPNSIRRKRALRSWYWQPHMPGKRECLYLNKLSN